MKSDDSNKNNSNSSSNDSPNSKWTVFSGLGKKKQPGRGDGSDAAKHHHHLEESSACMDNDGAVAKFDQKKGVWVPVRRQVSGRTSHEHCYFIITR